MRRSIAFLVVLGAITAMPNAAPSWLAPRAADGHPDLTGIWENISATPLERPAQFADKPLLSDEELADLQDRALRLAAPDQDAVFGDGFYNALLASQKAPSDGEAAKRFGAYGANWMPGRLVERRTSLITAPADGRLPPFTEAYVSARDAALAVRPRFLRGPEDASVTDRCVSYGVPDLFAAYMSLYRITQSRDTVVINMEKIHDARIVPLDGRPHISPKIRHYLGDPRGRWEGDTLVVESTNFHPAGNPMGGLIRLSDQNLTLTERFTRTGPDTIKYEFTVDDPTVWTRRWSAMVPWTRARGQIYEYACTEGNYSLRNMLSAARFEESHP